VVGTSQSSTSLSGASLTSGIDEAQEDSTSNQDQHPIMADHPSDELDLSLDSPDKSLDKIFWPRDILSYDERFQQARILTCGYDSHPIRFLQGQDRNGIKAHADAIMEDLIRMREADVGMTISVIIGLANILYFRANDISYLSCTVLVASS
jgi:hypothetical protein